jgi:hypothetical protein
MDLNVGYARFLLPFTIYHPSCVLLYTQKATNTLLTGYIQSTRQVRTFIAVF